MARKSSVEKSINKAKKSHPIAMLLVVIFLVVGCFAGYFVSVYLTKNDKFEIIGDKEIVLYVGEEYEELGAEVVAFGKDISSEIIIENEIDNTKAGTYYVKYTIDNFKYSGVVRYRYVTVVEGGANEQG